MISSTTLMLATLVFNAALVFGAPVRIPTVPEVAVRAVVDEPILPRVAIVDVQPEHKRSVDGTNGRPRLAREIAPELDTREPASPESVEIRDSLPEVEKIARRYPRRSLFEFYEKRSPEPSPAPSDPAAQPEIRSAPAEPQPELTRRFPRRVYHDYYAKRAEPAPLEARSEEPAPAAPQLQRRYPRRVYAEYYEKRSAPPTDNVPREPAPEPAPAPEPVPEPAPEPAPEPVASKPQEQERQHSPRAVDEPEDYVKRQEEGGPQTPPETPPPAPESQTTTTTSSPSPTATPPASGTTTSPTTAPTTPSTVPANLDFNRVIADAIVKGNSNTVHEGPAGKTNSYKDTTITIKITQQENSDRKLYPAQPGSTPPVSPPSSTTGDGKGSPANGGASPTSTSSTTAAPTGTPTSESTPPPPSGSPGSTPPADATTPPPDGGEGAPAAASRRDLGDDASASAQPITKRKLGLSGALWATWHRRNLN